MDKIIKKDIVNGVEYKYNGIGGGSSPTGEGHEVITQAAYDQLTPAQKAEKVYMIKESGVAPTDLQYLSGLANYISGAQPLGTANFNNYDSEVSIPEGATIIVGFTNLSSKPSPNFIPIARLINDPNRNYNISGTDAYTNIRYVSSSDKIVVSGSSVSGWIEFF